MDRTLSSHIYEEVEVYEQPCDSVSSKVNERTVVIKDQTRRDEEARYCDVALPMTAEEDEDNYGDVTGDEDVCQLRHSQTSVDTTPADNCHDDYYTSIISKIAEVEEQNAELLAELEELRDDFEAENEKRKTYASQNESLKAELKQTQQALQQHRDALQRLAAASETAFREFEQLKGSYAQEIVCRDKAEKYAATLFAEREAARRQSSMLLMNVAGDRKLMEAMMEVETLTTRVEQQKADYESQIQELQEEVWSLRDREGVEGLEETNRQLEEQLTALQAQNTAQLTQYTALLTHYEELEKRLEAATKPPPPPPPPPVPSPGRLTKIFGGGKKAKKDIIKQTVEAKGTAVTQSYSQALDEMMKRIKTGTQLRATPSARPPRQPTNPDEADGCTGMSELKNILGRMKKMPLDVGSGSSLAVSTREDNSELAKAFKKLQKSKAPDSNDVAEEKQSQAQQQQQQQQQHGQQGQYGQQEQQGQDEVRGVDRGSTEVQETPTELRQEQRKPVPRRRRGASVTSTMGPDAAQEPR